MKITFNGTGSSTGTPQLFCSCPVCTSESPENKRTRFSITIIEGETSIQIDAPFEIRQQLLNAKIRKIDALWLTHAHSDHIAGIDDLRMVSFENNSPLPLFAGAETIEILNTRFPYLFFENDYRETPLFKPVAINKRPFEFKNITFIPIEYFHGETVVNSFRIKDFAFLVDISGISQHELEKLKGAKVIAVSATTKFPHKKHKSLNQIIELIDEISPERAFLTHMNHSFDYLKIKKELPANVFPAFDGLTLEI
ncbi:MAG: MBL fold metallo-hydrolase [bacterium]